MTLILATAGSTADATPYGRAMLKRTQTPWPHYACDWSQNSSSFCTLAVGSFLPSRHNYIQIVSLPDVTSEAWQTVAEALPIEYVATKVLWSPSKVKNCEYLAAAGDGVYIWRNSDAGEASNFTLTGRLVSKHGQRRSSEDAVAHFGNTAGVPSGGEHPASTNPPAPITSFDWNKMDPTRIVTASYDTTCTVWCLETGTIKTQLIAHDKEVFDVAYSPASTESFVSVGADGSLRLFDIRNLDHSTIIYESGEARPLLRVAWNPLDPNYLATFALDSRTVVVMDVRMPSVPAAELTEHQGPVVAMRWSPASSSHLATADEQGVRLWDLADYDRVPGPRYLFEAASLGRAAVGTDSMLEPVPVQSLLWPAVAPEWMGITSADQVSIMHL